MSDWSFGGTWPFEPRWFETGLGRKHYIDEGPRHGRPVVMVHGNPTWGLSVPAFHPTPGQGRLPRHRARPSRLWPLRQALEEVHEGLRALADRPVFIAWAMKDIAFTPDILITLWLRDFPDAKVLRLEDAGHYLQEDAHERIVPALLEFLQDPDRR